MLKHGLELIAAENFKKAHTLFEQAISERPQDLRAYYYAGFAASRLEDLETAVLRFEQYLMLRPHDVGVMTDLGRLYERSGKWAQARRCYQRVLAWTPDSEIAGERLKELSRFQSGLTEGVEPQSTEQLLGEDTASTVSAPLLKSCIRLRPSGVKSAIRRSRSTRVSVVKLPTVSIESCSLTAAIYPGCECPRLQTQMPAIKSR